jgi:hypothetical protein
LKRINPFRNARFEFRIPLNLIHQVHDNDIWELKEESILQSKGQQKTSARGIILHETDLASLDIILRANLSERTLSAPSTNQASA